MSRVAPHLWAWSLVLEVALQSLRQRQRLDVMDALPAQRQPGRPPAQVHQGEGLRCGGGGETQLTPGRGGRDQPCIWSESRPWNDRRDSKS